MQRPGVAYVVVPAPLELSASLATHRALLPVVFALTASGDQVHCLLVGPVSSQTREVWRARMEGALASLANLSSEALLCLSMAPSSTALASAHASFA